MTTITFALSAFKGSINAVSACQAAQEGWTSKTSKPTIKLLPSSDGGDGLLECLKFQWPSAEFVSIPVTGPLGGPIESSYLTLRRNQKNTAFLETAKVCGLSLISPHEHNVMAATTYGLGEMIRHAINQGAQEIYIGLGGSATQDGGCGMAQALGARLADRFNKQIGLGNGWLSALDRISAIRVEAKIRKTPSFALCDVSNPLTGPQGSARNFAAQKGATKDQIEIIENNLRFYAEVIERDLHTSVNDLPGAGAAGGLGAGLAAFCRSKLVPGTLTFLELTNTEKTIASSDLIIVGEGRLDQQTAMGKTPGIIAHLAKKSGKQVFGIFGQTNLSDAQIKSLGFDEWITLEKICGSLNQALANPKEGISKAAAALAQRWNVLTTAN